MAIQAQLPFALILLFSSSVLCCNLNSLAPLPAKLAPVHAGSEPRKILLSNNVQLALPDADGVLQMHSADSLTVLDQLIQWPTNSGQINTIRAQPVVLDQDYDGIADAVYVVDVTGQLWFIPLTSQGFSSPQLLADFSQTAAEFHQPLQLVQVQSADSTGSKRRQTMLVVIGSLPQGDILLTVKHLSARRTPLQLVDLVDRTEISAEENRIGIAEHLWQQIQHGGGWFIRLDQRITALPQVYAGVVYLTSAAGDSVRSDCTLAENAAPQLHAIHLHHAGVIYARRQWHISAIDNGRLTLQLSDEGELELSLQNAQQQAVLLSELLMITEECADCVAKLAASDFPRVLRLATFQTEYGAH